MVLKTENREYTCYEMLDSVVDGYEEINKSLNFARNYALDTITVSKKEAPMIKVVAYDDEIGINAFATKQNDIYYIGISIDTFVELKKWFDVWLSYDNTYNALNLHVRDKDKIFNIMYHYSLAFLVAHECFHILQGHCDCPGKEGTFLFERAKDKKEEKLLFEQALEVCADCGAMTICAIRMMFDDNNKEVWEEKSRILSFSVYSVFKKFSEYEEYDFDNFMEEALYKYDHPHAGIRFQFVIRMLDNAIKHMKGINLDPSILNLYIKFEREILNIQNTKELFTIISYTDKGANNILELIKECNELEETLKDYSYMPIMKWADSDNSKAVVFIDDQGELIKCIEKTLKTEYA